MITAKPIIKIYYLLFTVYNFLNRIERSYYPVSKHIQPDGEFRF